MLDPPPSLRQEVHKGKRYPKTLIPTDSQANSIETTQKGLLHCSLSCCRLPGYGVVRVGRGQAGAGGKDLGTGPLPVQRKPWRRGAGRGWGTPAGAAGGPCHASQRGRGTRTSVPRMAGTTSGLRPPTCSIAAARPAPAANASPAWGGSRGRKYNKGTKSI